MFRGVHLQIGAIQVAVNPHFGRRSRAGPVGVVVIEGLRLGNIDVLVEMCMLLVRNPGAMRCFMNSYLFFLRY
ncbi:hypothetical protein [Paenibacillus sp. J2TS4]|uniref:hypothetical protein n=1 Tax=Paenibacillus sp. J2TS4 TaxID=2807194 RepID=UPI001B23A266|nr:hypothetical protein [Paenibacillus sp. J2TS4]GIP34207.1 hypothetical protein J2TS4_34170 [Paenibacillus sp. J2TS4]